MKIKIDRLDELTSTLKETHNEVNDVDGYSIEKILHPWFMSEYTQFSSIEEMLERSWYVIVQQDDLQKTADPKFTLFVKQTTEFASWDDMVSAAWKEFIKQKIRDL